MIRLDPQSPAPIYRQIVEQIRRLVAAGRLTDGKRLDSIRVLAGKLDINHMTVSRAYRVLADEGLIRCRQGRGVRVALRAKPVPPAEREAMLTGLIDPLLVAAHQSGVTLEDLEALIRRRSAGLQSELPELPPLSVPAPPAAPTARPPRPRPPRSRRPEPAAPIAPPIPEPPPAAEPEDISLL